MRARWIRRGLTAGLAVLAAVVTPLAASADSILGGGTVPMLGGFDTDPVIGCPTQSFWVAGDGTGTATWDTDVYAGLLDMSLQATSSVGGCQGATVQDTGTVTGWIDGPAPSPINRLSCGAPANTVTGSYFRIADLLFMTLAVTCTIGSSGPLPLTIFVDGSFVPVIDGSLTAHINAFDANVVIERTP